MSSNIINTERRKYPRYDMFLPVHFNVKKADKENPDQNKKVKYFQGFTKNFGKGGLLIEAFNIDDESYNLIKENNAIIEGSILIPSNTFPIRFKAKPAWSKEEANNITLIGVYFTEIAKSDISQLYDFAIITNKKNKMLKVTAILTIILFILVSGLVFYIHSISTKIIGTQSKTIKNLQLEQKNLKKCIENIVNEKKSKH